MSLIFLLGNLSAAIPTSCHLRGQRGLTTQRIAQQFPSRVQVAETDVHVPEISVQLAPKRVFTFDRNPPRWEEENPFALIARGGSFKSSVRTGARRYYLHNRVWLSHNDLSFFRTDPNHPDEPVTMNEATTLVSFMGMSGSIIKFGEDLRTLTPEQVNIWRRLLPIYPATARPLDLFTRMYPEEWLLRIDGSMAGAQQV